MRRRRAAVHHRHPDLAHQQHQRTQPTPDQDPTEDLRAAHSEEITQDRLDIRSYIDTLCKHGANVMSGIRAALTANSWRPPTLAPT